MDRGARWHLEHAIAHDDATLTEWCLTHGANPNAPPASDARLPKHSLYEEAVLHGSVDIAKLLLRHGAIAADVELSGLQQFARACMQLDRERATSMLGEHPEYRQASEPMHEAARRDRADVVALLLDLGVSPDVENASKERALHAAAYAGSTGVARVLIERGAEVDPVESNWGNTPLGAAAYSGHRELIDLLAPHSTDVWELTHAGKVERLRDVLAERPERARSVWSGHSLLMWVATDDEQTALETATLLLGHGADPTLRNSDGMTAADRAERHGMFELAALLTDAAVAYVPGSAIAAAKE